MTAKHDRKSKIRLLCISSHDDSLNSVRPEAEMFIGLVKKGVEVTVMTEGDSVYAAQMKNAEVRIIDFAPRKKFSLSAIRFIRSELQSGNYDFLYAFNNKAITNANFAAAGLPVKVITYRGQTGNIYRWDPTCYLTHLNPGVSLVICVADAVRIDLQAQHPHPERVVTVYKGHDLTWYQDKPADLGEFGIPPDAFVVACVANNRPRKGLPILLEASHRLSKIPNLHFLLIGGGMDDPALQHAIELSPMGERIHCAGYRQDAPSLIAACQASVLPSLKREGLPKTVIESMVYGVAPIVTDTGGSAELIEHEKSGIIIRPGNPDDISEAIEFLAQNPGKRVTMGDNARDRINSHFNVNQSIEQTLGHLQRLL